MLLPFSHLGGGCLSCVACSDLEFPSSLRVCNPKYSSGVVRKGLESLICCEQMMGGRRWAGRRGRPRLAIRATAAHSWASTLLLQPRAPLLPQPAPQLHWPQPPLLLLLPRPHRLHPGTQLKTTAIVTVLCCKQVRLGDCRCCIFLYGSLLSFDNLRKPGSSDRSRAIGTSSIVSCLVCQLQPRHRCCSQTFAALPHACTLLDLTSIVGDMGLLGWCRTKKALTDEERESQAKSLFSEFLSAGDSVEALTLARELAAPGEPTPSHLSPSSHATSANSASGGSKEHHCPAHLDRHISKPLSWNEVFCCSTAGLAVF